MALPVMTPEQRAAALAKARVAQRERASMIAAVRSGTSSLAEVLDRPDELARRTRIGQVLRAIPGYGPVRVTGLLAELGVEADKRLGTLTAAQRLRLLELAN